MPGEEVAPSDPLNPDTFDQPTYTRFEGHLYNDKRDSHPDNSIGINAQPGQRWVGAVLLAEDQDGQLVRYTVSFLETGGPVFRRTN